MGETPRACDSQWFSRASGARLERPGSAPIERVETDSRAAGPGVLFVALRGERVDGHDYAASACASGAAAVLVSGQWYRERGASALAAYSSAVICADDPLAALQRAATEYRKLFPSLKRIGVTGSSGKTTVKELTAAILARSRPVARNPGNMNSEIGLPASVFLLRPEHTAAVFELGINHSGEMDILAGVWEPDCAVINNIGSAHIGLLGGTREGIADEKRKIASRFTGSQTLIVWEDDPFRDRLCAGVRGRCLTFGPRSVDGFEGARSLGLEGWLLRYRGVNARLALPGGHNLLNALAAIRVAELYGAGADDVRDGLASALPLAGRSEIIRGPVTIVNDSYNANAESALAAIAFCDDAEAGRRIYVLGSMKELGAESDAAHRRVGAAAAVSKAELLYFYGDETRPAHEEALRVGKASYHFDNYDDLAQAVKAVAREGDLVLLKASRSMALERLVDALRSIGGTHVS
ncbi:MAG TPA: UDP-N-acetylmuramoyl-tripeptide--D-alanyl-D-alanine ligase [Spirochaetales bacterium]|nr:UDP-N-acetylmuramoyl-tripeptide--D-alanyl-D-alanine ligase [Spirochaetales bacterium]MBP7262690.1 UDP-N-acetylmuramoyl-tripeptide--D-alanyl-D-alanine ligase [Spirochaetia bacterium]HPE36468.1 UDP-N-acetylmuramoyl-tripeptide--D-alanyl-D-alanine ligase [Spirochaetales bacterium]